MFRVLVITLSAFFTLSCSGGNPDDGRESSADKHEWSILQTIELRNRNIANLEFIIIEDEGYSIAQIPNPHGIGATYIMLNPKAPLFYKQMPIQQYNISKKNFNVIVNHPKNNFHSRNGYRITCC
jgi:hypothetical protein